MKKSPVEIANEIKALATKLGWNIQVRSSILTIYKDFTPGSSAEFCKADSEYYSILSLLPNTAAGSTWGTDGSGIGAITAIKYGRMVMNKSGGSKRVLKCL